VLSLRALQDAGIDVPADAMHHAASFTRSCQKGSSFADPGQAPTTRSTTAGVCILLLTKEITAKDTELTKAATKPSDETDGVPGFLAALNLICSTDADAPTRGRALREALCAKQIADGSWPSQRAEGGSVFATSTAVLSLTASYRLLPIYPLSR